jgi:hypothetical protein
MTQIIVGTSGVALFSASAPLELEIDLLLFRPGVETPGFMPVPLRGGNRIRRDIPFVSSGQHNLVFKCRICRICRDCPYFPLLPELCSLTD